MAGAAPQTSVAAPPSSDATAPAALPEDNGGSDRKQQHLAEPQPSPGFVRGSRSSLRRRGDAETAAAAESQQPSSTSPKQDGKTTKCGKCVVQ